LLKNINVTVILKLEVVNVDSNKIGKLIFDLRIEKNMTQKELADAMNISDRTISKWERGIGCPDISLLNELADILEVNVENILNGNLLENNNKGDKVEKVKFYICPNCSNVLFSNNAIDISCCSRKLKELNVNNFIKNHEVLIEEVENDYFITIDHEMSKEHFISFVAFVGYDRVLLIRLYPEQNAQLRFPKMFGNKIYAYCTEHGLWKIKL